MPMCLIGFEHTMPLPSARLGRQMFQDYVSLRDRRTLERVCMAGILTKGLRESASTKEVTDAVCREIKKLAD